MSTPATTPEKPNALRERKTPTSSPGGHATTSHTVSPTRRRASRGAHNTSPAASRDSPKRRSTAGTSQVKKPKLDEDKDRRLPTSTSDKSGLAAVLTREIIKSIAEAAFDRFNKFLPKNARLGSDVMEEVTRDIHDEYCDMRTYAFTEVSSVFRDFVDEPASGDEYAIVTQSEEVVTPSLRLSVEDLGPKDASKTLADLLSDDAFFLTKVEELRASDHWRNILRFLSIKKEMSHRTLIDPTLFAALAIAIDFLAKNQEVDVSLRDRHSALERGAQHVEGVGSLQSWITLQEEVHLAGQSVDGVNNLRLRGEYDYVFGWVPAWFVAADVNAGRMLRKLEERFSNHTVNLAEAKTEDTVGATNSRNQSVAQGVAELCRGKKNAIVNVLTDGEVWDFIQVLRTKDGEHSKPFHFVSTRPFNVLASPDLRIHALVLKLLVAALLGDPEDFHLLAQVC